MTESQENCASMSSVLVFSSNVYVNSLIYKWAALVILVCSLRPQNSSSFQGCCAVQEPDIFLLLLFFLEFMVQF